MRSEGVTTTTTPQYSVKGTEAVEACAKAMRQLKLVEEEGEKGKTKGYIAINMDH